MNDELEQLCNSLLDDSLTEAQHQRLEDILRDDRMARERFRNYMKIHAVIRREYSALAAELEQSRAKRPRTWPWAIIVRSAMAALLMVVVMIGIVYSGQTVTKKNILSLMALTNGDLVWSSETAHRRRLIIGDQVPAGLLQLEGEAANAVLQFADGTNLRVSGHAEIIFNEQAQKIVQLKGGNFFADVRPQPAGFPMLITTPTAQLQILGTVFSVCANETSTALDVESGHVRMQRLVDGQSIDVMSQQSAVASRNTANELSKQQRLRPLEKWTSNFSHEPPSYCKGRWIPSTAHQPGFVQSAPLKTEKKDNGTARGLYGMTVRSPVGREEAFVHVGPYSAITMRYRASSTNPQSMVKLFFYTRNIKGGFGGNFEFEFKVTDGAVESNGWRTISLSTINASPLIPDRFKVMSDNDVVLIMAFTTDEKDQLEVAHIEVDSESSK